MKKIILFCSIMSLISPMIHAAPEDENLRQMSERLLTLRSEVETLTLESTADNKRRQAEVETLVQRKSELQMQLLKEEMRTAQIREKLSLESGRATQQSPSSTKDRESLQAAFNGIEKWIQQSLPFRREERMGALTNLRKRLENENAVEPIISQTWSLIDKEIKLTQENAFEIADLEFEDGRHKSEAMRVGMHQLYFKRADGKVGRFDRVEGQWKPIYLEDAALRQSIERLSQRLQKQKGHGYFELPGLQVEAL